MVGSSGRRVSCGIFSEEFLPGSTPSPLAASALLPTHHLGPQGCLTNRELREVLKARPNLRGRPSWSVVLAAVGALAWALPALLMEKGPRAGDGHQRQCHIRALDRAVAENRGAAKGTNIHWYKSRICRLPGGQGRKSWDTCPAKNEHWPKASLRNWLTKETR